MKLARTTLHLTIYIISIFLLQSCGEEDCTEGKSGPNCDEDCIETIIGTWNVTNIQPASDYQDRNFGNAWGTLIEELKIMARAIFVLDAEGTIKYVEYVGEVAEEPNYDAAMAALKELL